MSTHETIVYRIVDRKAWSDAPNPFTQSPVNGLKPVGMCHGDAMSILDRIEEVIASADTDFTALEQIKKILEERFK